MTPETEKRIIAKIISIADKHAQSRFSPIRSAKLDMEFQSEVLELLNREIALSNIAFDDLPYLESKIYEVAFSLLVNLAGTK